MFKQAAACYEQGLKLMAPGAPDSAALYCNRAACFLHLRQYADVVVEATRALKISPKYDKALLYRAKAYNATGQAKKAKADAKAALEVNPKYEDAKAMVDSFEPKKEVQGLGGLGLAPPKKGGKKGDTAAAAAAPAEESAAMKAAREAAEARAAAQAKQRQQQRAWGPPITVKAQCGDDMRSIIVPSMISHKDLMTSLQRKFPDNTAFTVRYTAEDGTLKPLNSRVDFVNATTIAAKKNGNNKYTLHGIPSVKLTITELARLDAPKVDDGDAAAAGGDAAAEQADAPPALAPNEVVEIDEWILDFAALFREHLGIDAEAHLDLHAEVRLTTRLSFSLLLPLFFCVCVCVCVCVYPYTMFSLSLSLSVTHAHLPSPCCPPTQPCAVSRR